MKVGMFQMPVASCPEVNMLAIRKAMEAASKEQSVNLLLTPELSVPSYRDLMALLRSCSDGTSNDKEECSPRHEVPDALSSERVTRLCGWCKEFQIALVVGVAERAGDENGDRMVPKKLHNVTLFIDKVGHICARYCKSHLCIGHERSCFTTTTEPNDTIVPFMGYQIGILCCFDVEFPENVRSLRLRGANFIIAPSAAYDGMVHRHMIRIRSYENACFVAYPNAIGPSELGILLQEVEGGGDSSPSDEERNNGKYDSNNLHACCFKGGSCITGPDGTDVLRMPFIEGEGFHVPRHHGQWPRPPPPSTDTDTDTTAEFTPDIEVVSSSKFSLTAPPAFLTGVSDLTLRVVEIRGDGDGSGEQEVGFEGSTAHLCDGNAFLKLRRPELYRNLV